MKRFICTAFLLISLFACPASASAVEAESAASFSSVSIPEFTGRDPFDPDQHEWSDSEYLVFEKESVFKAVNTIQFNVGNIVDVVGYIFLLLLSVYAIIYWGMYFIR